MSFKVGDKVYAGDWCEGTITEIVNDDVAYIEFATDNGGGCLPFGLDELKRIPHRTATLRAGKSSHGTVHVVIQNCEPEVAALLWRFDVLKSNGRFEYDENKTNERPKIWFECPMEFLDFVKSSMGRACFQRMGVEEFYIEH